MARETKTERERRQVAGFLRDFIAYDELESVKPDPPDVRVWHNGSPILNLEVTEYHDEPEEVASNTRWTERLWPRVDELRRKDPSAKNILGFVVFSNSKLPTLNRADDEQLADELVRLAKQVSPTLGNAEELKISFLARAALESHPIIQTLQPRWHFFPKEEWPLCSLHVGAVTFSKEPFDWPRWTCPQVDAGWTRQTTAKFRSIFDDKEAKVRKALHDASRFSPAVPIWLVIVSDLYNDLTSHLFPGSQDDRKELFASIRETKYDFSHSPFAEVWLYADFNHARLRLFPFSEVSKPSTGYEQ